MDTSIGQVLLQFLNATLQILGLLNGQGDGFLLRLIARGFFCDLRPGKEFTGRRGFFRLRLEYFDFFLLIIEPGLKLLDASFTSTINHHGSRKAFACSF